MGFVVVSVGGLVRRFVLMVLAWASTTGFEVDVEDFSCREGAVSSNVRTLCTIHHIRIV